MITLTVAGKAYADCISARVTRGLKRVASDFEFETPASAAASITPFASCVIAEDGAPLLTGYVDDIELTVGGAIASAVVRGRSKTEDLIDCMPPFPTNQFLGYRLDAVARTLAQPFGVGVVIGPGVELGDLFLDATFERSETAFAFLERLARQRGVMLTDDENGNLVIATAGTARAGASLTAGPAGNVSFARGRLRFADRFSQYTVRSQVGMTGDNTDVLTAIEASAYDWGVPRYRPWAGLAESALMPDEAQLRAQWEASHRLGAALQAVLTVPEWRQSQGGALWAQNQLVYCDVPRLLGLIGDMLIAQTDFRYDGQGKRTDLTVGPPQGFTPEPGAIPLGVWGALVSVDPQGQAP